MVASPRFRRRLEEKGCHRSVNVLVNLLNWHRLVYLEAISSDLKVSRCHSLFVLGISVQPFGFSRHRWMGVLGHGQ